LNNSNGKYRFFTRLTSANKAAVVAAVAFALGILEEVGGFGVSGDMGMVAIGIGGVYTGIWLLTAYFPPKSDRRSSDRDKPP